jgi:hypothetical protein
MRRFLIESKKYTGQIEVVYAPCPPNGELLLQRIDFTQAELSGSKRASFKQMLPVTFGMFEPMMIEAGATVVEEAYTVSFDDYWKAVKKKVNRKRCEMLWGKMGQMQRVKAVMALPDYYRYLQRVTRYEVDPERYLKEEYYETEWRKL